MQDPKNVLCFKAQSIYIHISSNIKFQTDTAHSGSLRKHQMLHLGVCVFSQLFLIQLPSCSWISKHMPSTACRVSNDFYFAGVSKTNQHRAGSETISRIFLNCLLPRMPRGLHFLQLPGLLETHLTKRLSKSIPSQMPPPQYPLSPSGQN